MPEHKNNPPAPAPAPGPDGAWPDGEPRGVVDRRMGLNRRSQSRTGLEHVRGPGRRRTDFTRSAEEGQMSQEQFLFIMAIDAFKRVNRKQFPTWTEVLEVMRKLGYRKTAASELSLSNVEDWREAPDAPAMTDPPKQRLEIEEA